jgi:dynein heavy chain 1
MEVLPAIVAPLNNGDGTESLALAPDALADHVTLLLLAAMGTTSTEAAFLRTSMARSRLERLANDASCTVLFVKKDEELTESVSVLGDNSQLTSDDQVYRYSLDINYQHTQSTVASLALIKLVPQLDAQIPIERQLQFLNLPGTGTDNAPGGYEALHSIIKLALAPYFDSIAHAQEPISQTSKSGRFLPGTRSR